MTYCESVARHYQDHWSARSERCVWPKGPRSDLPREFSVLRFAPFSGRAAWTYCTVCMSQPYDQAPLELHLLSPVESIQHVELLTAVAHYHRTGAQLGLGHTVNFGRPWLPESACTYGLVSLPYLDGPTLENLEVEGTAVRFLWLVPITEREVEFKKERGLETLENRLEESKFNYLDAKRPGVV